MKVVSNAERVNSFERNFLFGLSFHFFVCGCLSISLLPCICFVHICLASIKITNSCKMYKNENQLKADNKDVIERERNGTERKKLLVRTPAFSTFYLVTCIEKQEHWSISEMVSLYVACRIPRRHRHSN